MADEPAITPADTSGDTPPAEGDTPPVDTSGDTPPVGDDTPPTDDKDTTGSDDDGTAPESYSDFTLPEGVELDAALLEKAAPIFKELGLSQDAAQKLVDFQAEMVKEGEQSQTDTFNTLVEGWQNESKNDKEFGGDKFDENIGIAKLAIDEFGTPEFKELMEDHGVGNHPEMIRFMLKIGTLLKEDVPGGFSAATSEKKDRVSTLYPNDS